MTSPKRQPARQEQRTPPREADIVAMPMPAQRPPWQREPELERIGDILRRTRERRGDDLQAIADYLCIRRSFLEALEDSRYDEFPADAYVIGFLRSYAELIGLDPKKAVDRYRDEMSGRRKKPSLVLPTPITEGRSPSVFVMIGAIIAAILVYAAWYGLSTPDRASVSVAPALPSTTADTSGNNSASPSSIALSAPPPPESIVPGAQPAPTAADQTAAPADAPAKPPHLILKAKQSSWVMISDAKGATVFDRVLKPGETFTVPDKSGLTLTTGNGEGLLLTLDGVDLPKLSGHQQPSGITRDIPLDDAHLKGLAAAKD